MTQARNRVQTFVKVLATTAVIGAVIAAISLWAPRRQGIEFGNPCKMQKVMLDLIGARIPFEFDGRSILVNERNGPELKRIVDAVEECPAIRPHDWEPR